MLSIQDRARAAAVKAMAAHAVSRNWEPAQKPKKWFHLLSTRAHNALLYAHIWDEASAASAADRLHRVPGLGPLGLAEVHAFLGIPAPAPAPPKLHTGPVVLWADVPAEQRMTEADYRSRNGASDPRWLARCLTLLRAPECPAAVNYGYGKYSPCAIKVKPGNGPYCATHRRS